MVDSVLATAYLKPEILCYVTPEDDSYEPLAFPEVHFVVGERLIMSDLWNALIPHAAGNIFMLCADDVLFRTKNWDVIVEAAFAESQDKILLCYGDDGGPAGKVFATLPFISRRWAEVVGYFTGPGFSADYSDTWVQDVADMIGRKKFLPIVTEHMHHTFGKSACDQVYKENLERYARDNPAALYRDRLAERQRDADKLRAVMAQ
jgi:hypothetical protein